jgi:hypothetical protein
MEDIFKPLGDAWEAIYEKLFGPAAPEPTGAHAWDVACQPLTETEFFGNATAPAIAELLDLFPAGAAIYDPTRIRLKRITKQGGPQGKTSRDMATAKDYLVELNSWEDPARWTNRTHYDLTLRFIHELAHVRDADDRGFMPHETAALLSEKEFIILAWQSEYIAFRFQLDGAITIFESDKARFGECWELSVLEGVTPLSALQGGNKTLARKIIRDSYPESKIRAKYANASPDPPTAALSNAVNAFMAAGNLDSPTLWGL